MQIGDDWALVLATRNGTYPSATRALWSSVHVSALPPKADIAERDVIVMSALCHKQTSWVDLSDRAHRTVADSVRPSQNRASCNIELRFA